MTGFELWISGDWSDYSTNCAKTNALHWKDGVEIALIFILKFNAISTSLKMSKNYIFNPKNAVQT